MVAGAVTKYVVAVDYKDLRGYLTGEFEVTSNIREANIYETQQEAEDVAFIIRAVALMDLPELKTKVLPRTVFEMK